MPDRRSRGYYIARPPLSLKKITYEPFKGRVLFHTTYSDYFKENLHMFDALDFIAELTQHIPPKGCSSYVGMDCIHPGSRAAGLTYRMWLNALQLGGMRNMRNVKDSIPLPISIRSRMPTR